MNQLNGCDILTHLNNTCDVYSESAEKYDPYDRIFDLIGEPTTQKHIICVGFVEGSGPYKKVMDMYDEYVHRGYLPPVIVITRKIRDKKLKIRNFFNERNVKVELIEDTDWGNDTDLAYKYEQVSEVIEGIKSREDIQGCVAHGRPTLFAQACNSNNVPYVMMHGSAPDKTITNEVDKDGNPVSMFHYEAYKNSKGFLITALLTNSDEIDKHFQKEIGETPTNFEAVFQPYKTEFKERLQEAMRISPEKSRSLISEREVFETFDPNTPFVYVSRSGTLFDTSELDNPDSLFVPEHLEQSLDSLLKVLDSVEKIGSEYSMPIQVYMHKNALKRIIDDGLIDNYKNILFLKKNGPVIADEDYLLLRKGGVELSRAAQSGATTIGYGVGGMPILYTVPYRDDENDVEDYMFETVSADVFGERGCPVIDPTGEDVQNELESNLLAMLRYKNSKQLWYKE